MTAAGWPALRPAHLLAVAAVALTSLAAWPWVIPPMPQNRLAPRQETRAPPAALAPLPALGTFSAIVERPLFAPSRRPAPGAPVALGPSTESRYRLLGIVGNGSKRHAFIADGARRIEVGDGDTLDGWTVKDVGQDRVLLSSPTGDASLKLSSGAAEIKRQ